MPKTFRLITKYALVLVFLSGCDSQPQLGLPTQQSDDRGISMKNSEVTLNDLNDLANHLITLGYIDFFHRMDDNALNEVWQRPNSRQSLEKLVADRQQSNLARFIAAEILIYKAPDYLTDKHKAILVPLYAEALAKDYTSLANTWGLPGVLDGLTGQHFVALGTVAIPELTNLLDDTSEIYYAGSKEATFGNSYRYRVKDLAAFYISQIKNIPFDVDIDPIVRDVAIDILKTQFEGAN